MIEIRFVLRNRCLFSNDELWSDFGVEVGLCSFTVGFVWSGVWRIQCTSRTWGFE